jgi:hypothetical protein
MKNLKGLATGIGSLPHKDIEAALALIFKYVPQIPFWPQLPKRDVREGMIAQFSENLPCLKVAREGLFFSSLEDREKGLEIFYEHIIAEDMDYFKISQDFALGLYKFYQRLKKTASIKDDKGIALLHNQVFMQAILKGLMMKALWQIKFLQKFGKKIILFIDEPYLAAFGSAYTPINREEVVKGLEELTSAVKSADVLVGVHCCGNTDWSIFTDVQAIDVINFDAFGFLERFILYADNLKKFLERGGIICWGIVPTQEFTGKETTELLLKKIKDGVEVLAKKGIDKELLLDQLLITPSCGAGTLDIHKSEQIFKLLSEVSLSIRKTL